MDTLRKALDEIAGMAHDEVCNTQRIGREHLGCSCHVGIAEQALKTWAEESKPIEHVAGASRTSDSREDPMPIEHVAVVKPGEPGTVHFEPPFVSKNGAIVQRMDVRNNADGSIGIGIATLAAVRQDPPAEIGMTEEALDRCAYFLFPKLRAVAKRWPAHPDHPAEKALARKVVEAALSDLARYKHGVVRVDLELVDRYRKARVASFATLGPHGDALGYSSAEVDRVLRERHEACVDLANAVVAALNEDHPTPGTPVEHPASGGLIAEGGPAQAVETPAGCPGGVITVPPVDPRAVSPALVDRYRAARAKLEQARKFSPSPPDTLSPTEMDFLGDLRMRAVDLAEHVIRRADALVTADASLLGHLRSLIHGSVYTLGNPMSGLGGNTTVQMALDALREAEALLEPPKSEEST